MLLVRRICHAVEDLAHRYGRCAIDPPSWAYDLTFGDWADYTVKPLNPGNLWWCAGQWVCRQASRWDERRLG